MTVLLWFVVVLSVLLLAGVVGVEETRVHEAHREADSWKKRTCHHGSTGYDPSDPDNDLRHRGSRWSA